MSKHACIQMSLCLKCLTDISPKFYVRSLADFFPLFLKSFRLSDTAHLLPVFCSPLVHFIFKGHTAYCGVYRYFRNHLIGTEILFYASLTNCVFLKAGSFVSFLF